MSIYVFGRDTAFALKQLSSPWLTLISASDGSPTLLCIMLWRFVFLEMVPVLLFACHVGSGIPLKQSSLLQCVLSKVETVSQSSATTARWGIQRINTSGWLFPGTEQALPSPPSAMIVSYSS